MDEGERLRPSGIGERGARRGECLVPLDRYFAPSIWRFFFFFFVYSLGCCLASVLFRVLFPLAADFIRISPRK